MSFETVSLTEREVKLLNVFLGYKILESQAIVSELKDLIVKLEK